ncbi:GNAT family N-acetyltransferase [Actinokineospora auranticolor]|uniref:Putative N-acetyltransferase YhbS n=1 Tax=Actinokineospora auranticolor TaxID=155976 RepID=A0A2S6GG35_9PSEU|nr:GNAT family N-acetyltransferase [Actinokineospora auranticolor]PPK64106.1 putative N-acetyltransferase YhbS [Actinokineospora auranticolor]
MEIRPVRSADAPAVTALLVELGYPDNTEAGVRRRLARWSGTEHGAAFVAESGGRVVGVVAVAAIPLLEREGALGRIVALVVDETRRGSGVGRGLVAAAEAAARELGCVVMEVTSSRHRTGAHAFYRALGYEDWCDQKARFVRELGDRPAASPVPDPTP